MRKIFHSYIAIILIALMVTGPAWAVTADKYELNNVADSGAFYFTAGAHEPVVGETLHGDTSGETFEVVQVTLLTGAWDGTGTGSIYFKNLTGSGLTSGEEIDDSGHTKICDMNGDDTEWRSVLSDINNIALDTDSPGQITSSIASMESAKGSQAVYIGADPGGSDHVIATVDATQTIAIPSTFFGFNLNVKNLVRATSGWSYDH